MNFTHLVGNTPMIRIRYRLDGQEQSVWAKLEAYNLSGSIKDRLAAHVIAKSTANGTLKPGQPIVEMTSGNTGIAFAALGALTKHPVHIFMPDWASEERKKLMAMYGAVLHLVSREEGGFNAALQGAKDMAEEIGAFQPRQFENQDNPEAHYLTTGVEILRQLPGVTDFVAGVGSGGTLMGTARRLKEAGQCRAVAVEPDAAALLTGGTVTGPHRIEGIGDDFIPAVVDPTLIDQDRPGAGSGCGDLLRRKLSGCGSSEPAAGTAGGHRVCRRQQEVPYHPAGHAAGRNVGDGDLPHRAAGL